MFRFILVLLIVLSTYCFGARPSLDLKPLEPENTIDSNHKIPKPEKNKEENTDEFGEAYSSLIWETTPPIKYKYFENKVAAFYFADLESASAETGIGWGKYWLKRYRKKPFVFIGIHIKKYYEKDPSRKWLTPTAYDKGDFSKLLQIKEIPFFVIFDNKGKITYYKNIPPTLEYIDSLIMEY